MKAKYNAWEIQHESELRDYFGMMQNAAAVRTELQMLVNSYKRAVPFLQPGRLVQLRSKIEGILAPLLHHHFSTPLLLQKDQSLNR